MGNTDDKICNDHNEHKSRLERNEKDIQRIWKEINMMKTWVIVGMAALLSQVVGFFIALFLGKL